MRRLLSCLALAGLVMATACNQATGQIAWRRSSFADVLAEAGKRDMLVMIDFYTDWCVWCKKLDSETYTSAEVIKRAAALVSMKIDAEKGEGPELARKYSVNGYPMILFVDKSGREVYKIQGYLPPAEFAAEMDRALAAK